MIKDIIAPMNSKEQFEQAKQVESISVFVFSAEWCRDCRFIEPFLPQLIEKYASYHFYYVDRDAWMEFAQEQMVMGIPSFIAVGNGKELGRFVSGLRKTQQEIDAFLASLNEDIEQKG